MRQSAIIVMRALTAAGEIFAFGTTAEVTGQEAAFWAKYDAQGKPIL